MVMAMKLGQLDLGEDSRLYLYMIYMKIPSHMVSREWILMWQTWSVPNLHLVAIPHLSHTYIPSSLYFQLSNKGTKQPKKKKKHKETKIYRKNNTHGLASNNCFSS